MQAAILDYRIRMTRNPDNTLETETVFGPLIIWAKTCRFEWKVGSPALTPLEWQVHLVNDTTGFRRFVNAAHGRVRPSVRWRSNSERRRALKAAGQNWFRNSRQELSATRNGRRQIRAIDARHAVDQAIKQAYPSYEESECLLGGTLPEVQHLVRMLVRGDLEDWMLRNEYWDDSGSRVPGLGPFDHLVAYARVAGDRDVLRLLGRWLSSERTQRSALYAMTLKRLRAEAYLNHVRQRVTVPRVEAHLPRPVHVRPRPPTAPVAPPLR